LSNQGFLRASGNQPAIFTEYPAGDTSRDHKLKHCSCKRVVLQSPAEYACTGS